LNIHHELDLTKSEVNNLHYLYGLVSAVSYIDDSISLFCLIFCVLKYLHGIEVHPKQQSFLDYTQMEVGCGVS